MARHSMIAALAVAAVAGLWQGALAQEAPEDCYDAGVALMGNVLEEFANVMKMDYECHLFCQYEDACVAWTYMDTSDSSSCTLFTEVTGMNSTAPGAISGPKECEGEIDGPVYSTPSPTPEMTEAPTVEDFPDSNMTMTESPTTMEGNYTSTESPTPFDSNYTWTTDSPTPLYTEAPTMSNATNATSW